MKILCPFFTRLAPQGIVCYTFSVLSGGKDFLVICLARLGVIFLLRKSDIAPDGRSDILFAFVISNARSAYHCRWQYHARSAYHSPQANRVGASALSQVRQSTPFSVIFRLLPIFSEPLSASSHRFRHGRNSRAGSCIPCKALDTLLRFRGWGGIPCPNGVP